MAWVERYGAELSAASGVDCGLDGDQADALLDLARDVAHGTERRFAPLSAFVAGRYVAARVAAGVPADQALDEAVALARRALDEGGDQP